MVSQWIIIAGLVLVALLFFKIKTSTKLIKAILIILVGFAIYVSVMGVVSSNNINLHSPQGVINSVYVYFTWIGQTSSNLWNVGTKTVVMVGDAIRINNSRKNLEGN